MVPYTPGVLEVFGYDAAGNKIVSEKKVTSGAPKKLMLTLETRDISANGEDLAVVSCYTVDENGNEVYDATPVVDFFTNDLGKIYSTGSDIADHECIFATKRRMRAGRIGVAVKVGSEAGELKVYAESAGLERAVLTVNLKKKDK